MPDRTPYDRATDLHDRARTAPGTVDFASVAALLRSRHSPSVDRHLLSCLAALADDRPDAVASVAGEVGARLSLSDDRGLNAPATDCLAEIADADPAPLIDLVPMLAALLDDDAEGVRRGATYVLSRIASAYPDAVRPAVPSLADATTDDGGRAVNALSALASVADWCGTLPADARDDVAELARHGRGPVRANAVAVLANVARHRPADVEQHAEVLLAAVEEGEPGPRTNAAAGIAAIAREHPAAVSAAVPALVELLEADDPRARRNACRALGRLASAGDPAAASALDAVSALADADADPDVRRLASWAVSAA